MTRSKNCKILTGLALLLSFMLTQGCTKSETLVEDDGILGRWSLTETLADPGDGSGVFQPTDMQKILEFRTDGTVVSLTPFCASEKTEPGQLFSAPYSEDDKTITPACREGMAIRYELNGSEELTLYFPCFEPCGEKYRRLAVGDDQ